MFTGDASIEFLYFCIFSDFFPKFVVFWLKSNSFDIMQIKARNFNQILDFSFENDEICPLLVSKML